MNAADKEEKLGLLWDINDNMLWIIILLDHLKIFNYSRNHMQTISKFLMPILEDKFKINKNTYDQLLINLTDFIILNRISYKYFYENFLQMRNELKRVYLLNNSSSPILKEQNKIIDMRKAVIDVLTILLDLRVATLSDTSSSTIDKYIYAKNRVGYLIQLFRIDENRFAEKKIELNIKSTSDRNALYRQTDTDLKNIEEIAFTIMTKDFTEDKKEEIKRKIDELNKSFEEREIIQQHGEIPKNEGGKKSKKQPKKEILGKIICIHKIPGNRKEYVKHKGKLITVKDYKELMKGKKAKK